MSNITEKEFKDWFFKNCTEKQGSELNPPKVSLAPYDLYKKLWRYFESLNKVSDECKHERKDNVGKAAEYLKKYIEYAIAIHGKIIRESSYGGSVFIVFEDMVCYRLNFQAYNNEVTADESQPQQKEVEEDVCPECGCKECCCM